MRTLNTRVYISNIGLSIFQLRYIFIAFYIKFCDELIRFFFAILKLNNSNTCKLKHCSIKKEF